MKKLPIVKMEQITIKSTLVFVAILTDLFFIKNLIPIAKKINWANKKGIVNSSTKNPVTIVSILKTYNRYTDNR